MKREIPLAHPGIILAEDWLAPMGISQYALASAIGVPPRRINEIVKGLRGVTVDTALRLGAYFGTDAQSWINLQTHYDTELARGDDRHARLDCTLERQARGVNRTACPTAAHCTIASRGGLTDRPPSLFWGPRTIGTARPDAVGMG